MANLFKNSVKNLLKNKIVLYVLVALALTNILGYISMNNNQAIVLFISLGLITSFFCKNMIVILIVPLILVNLLIGVNVGVEAMSNKKEKTEEGMKHSKDGVDEENPESAESTEVPENMLNKTKTEELLTMNGNGAVSLEQMEPMLNKAESMLNRIEALSSIFNGTSKK